MSILRRLGFEIDWRVNTDPLQDANDRTDSLINRTNRLGNTIDRYRANFSRSFDNINQRYETASRRANDLRERQSQLYSQLNRGSGIIGKLVAGFGVYASVSKGIEAIKLASSMTETQNKLNVVFGAMSKDANKWAETYSDSMGFSVMKTKEGMGDIQNLFTGFGMARDTSFALSKDIIKLANDLDSFNNLSSRGVDVQNTMTKALMGETESAKTLGASISEANLNIASAQMGLGKFSTKMSETTKIQIRFHAIQMQSKDAIGDVARNLDTEVGLRRRLNAQMENNMIMIGQKLMPVWMNLLSSGLNISNMITNNIDKFDMFVQILQGGINVLGQSINFINQHKLVFAGLIALYTTYKVVVGGAFAIQKAMDMWTATQTTIAFTKATYALIAQNFQLGVMKTQMWLLNTAQKILTAGQWLLNTALLANPITWVVLGISAFIGILVVAYNKSETFRNTINNLWEVISNNPLASFVDNAKTKLQPFFDWITEKFKIVTGLFEKFNIGDKISSGITGSFGNVKETMTGLTQGIRDFLPFSPAKIGPLSDIDKTGAGLVNTVSSSIEKNKPMLDNSMQNVLTPSNNNNTNNNTNNSTITNNQGGINITNIINIENLSKNNIESVINQTVSSFKEKLAKELGALLDQETASAGV